MRKLGELQLHAPPDEGTAQVERKSPLCSHSMGLGQFPSSLLHATGSLPSQLNACREQPSPSTHFRNVPFTTVRDQINGSSGGWGWRHPFHILFPDWGGLFPLQVLSFPPGAQASSHPGHGGAWLSKSALFPGRGPMLSVACSGSHAQVNVTWPQQEGHHRHLRAHARPFGEEMGNRYPCKHCKRNHIHNYWQEGSLDAVRSLFLGQVC